jgi:hypothetical protein
MGSRFLSLSIAGTRRALETRPDHLLRPHRRSLTSYPLWPLLLDHRLAVDFHRESLRSVGEIAPYCKTYAFSFTPKRTLNVLSGRAGCSRAPKLAK